MQVFAVGMPAQVRELIEAGADGVQWTSKAVDVGAAHLFATRRAELAKHLRRVRAVLQPTGFIWVSWPKRASGVATDLTESSVRELALSLKLVDVKVCAVTQVWSGLKLVIRIKDRA